MKRYEPKRFPRLKGLSGISDGLLQDHFKLYEGYVKNVNELTVHLEALAKEGKAKGTNPAFAGITRQLGFEYGGMVLHELYFGNLAPEPDPLSKAGPLAQALAQGFGSVEAWLDDFKAIAAMRGVGWAGLRGAADQVNSSSCCASCPTCEKTWPGSPRRWPVSDIVAPRACRRRRRCGTSCAPTSWR